MPVTKKGDKWYWGDKGPFDSRKKAEEVQRAAYASGYEKMVNSPVGASDEGTKAPSAGEIARNERLRKEDGGVSGAGGTVFTSTNTGVFTPTFGGGGRRKKNKHNKLGSVGRFMDNGTPKIFSKELQDLEDFLEKSPPGGRSDNFESQNRMNNPKRLDWKKKRDDVDTSVAHTNMPEGQFYKEDPPDYVERGKTSQDKEKWSEYTLAHQGDTEKKIRGYDKESKKRHGDPDEPPAAQMGGSAGQIDYSGLNKQEGYASAGQNDELSRTGENDKLGRRRNDYYSDEEEEDPEDEGRTFVRNFMQKCLSRYEENFIVKVELDDVS